MANVIVPISQRVLTAKNVWMDTLTNHGDLLIKANLMFAKVSKKQPVYQSRFSNHVVKNIFEKFEY